MKQKPTSIKVARISAITVIIAAIITGLFGLFGNNKQSDKSINANISVHDSGKVSITNNQNDIKGDFVKGDKVIVNNKGSKDYTNTKINAPKALIVTQNQTGDNTLYVSQISDSYATSSDSTYIKEISYPSSGEFGLNILDKNTIQYSAGTYSMNALIPKNQNLTVEISGRNWFFPFYQALPGWRHFDYKANGDTFSRTFKTVKYGKVDLEFNLKEASEINIRVFENNAKNYSWQKTIKVEDKITDK